MMACLPIVGECKEFALKGGTAINFFIRNMPRLSVDIDLTYLPIDNRESSLRHISDLLKNISVRIQEKITESKVIKASPKGKSRIHKLFIQRGDAQIKIEPNEVLRGTVFKPEILTLSKSVQELFEMELDMKILSIGDLYGGKLCAALDRQHPRDLFDVQYLLKNEGIAKEIKTAFITYLLSHNRPINELINPSRQDISVIFEREFEGMSLSQVSLKDLCQTREELVSGINQSLTDLDKKFILSFKEGLPDWSLFPVDIKHLPGVKWKLLNINQLKSQQPQKHIDLYNKLKNKLSCS